MPNNTRDTALSLGTIQCGSQLSTVANGTTAHDGSNAWYVVTFAGPAFPNPSCTLHIDLSSVLGVVFDVFKNSDPTPFLGQTLSVIEPSPSGFGATETLYIHVYDNFPPVSQGGQAVSGPFTLTLLPV